MPNNPLGPRPGGNASVLNISAANRVKNAAGILYRVCVTTAGSGAGSVYDNNSTSTGNTAAHKIGVVPNAVGVYNFTWPCNTGIVFVPGSGQVASISFA